MRRLRPGLVAALAVGSLALGGCGVVGSPSHGAVARNLWRVGPFTVRRTNVPASVFDDASMALIGDRTLLRVGAKAPYTVSRRTLGSKSWLTVDRLDCASQPSWTAIQGPAASLLCLGSAPAPNRLILFYQDGAVASYDLALHLPTPVPTLDFGGEVIGGKQGALVWSVLKNSEPPVRYGLGVLDLATGGDGPEGLLFPYQPAKGQLSPMLAPDDTMYGLSYAYPAAQQATVYRWSMSERSWVKTGAVPSDVGATVVAHGGSLWASDSADLAHWLIEREVPGSRRVQKWHIDGDLIGLGPGYVVYSPYYDSASVDLYFLLQHGTLRFPGLVNPFTWAQGVGVMSMPRQYGTQQDVVVVGKGDGLQEIAISTN